MKSNEPENCGEPDLHTQGANGVSSRLDFALAPPVELTPFAPKTYPARQPLYNTVISKIKKINHLSHGNKLNPCKKY